MNKKNFVMNKKNFVTNKKSFVKNKKNFVMNKKNFVRNKKNFVMNKKNLSWQVWATVELRINESYILKKDSLPRGLGFKWEKNKMF